MLNDRAGSAATAALIARESEGSPFFVRELAAYVNERGIEASSHIRIGTLIATQLDALSRDGRDLLSMIAVAGRPIAAATIRDASQLGSGTLKAFRELEARRLVSSTRTDAGVRVECYHDRIREAAYVALTSEQAAGVHRALAQALESRRGGRQQRHAFCPIYRPIRDDQHR